MRVTVSRIGGPLEDGRPEGEQGPDAPGPSRDVLESASVVSITRDAFERRLQTPYCRFVKPITDRIAGGVLSILTLPVALTAGLLIRVTMRQRAIFRQQRVGKDGEVFTVYKLQTMVPDRRRNVVPFEGPERRLNHKTKDDPRVTGVGRFLRKWSVDEIPQFWNVARGDMSLVGPRPELVDVVSDYEDWQHHRHLVRPGITGIWQVSERGETPMHEAVELDLVYLERISLWTDFSILLRTVPAALGLRAGF